MKLSLPLLGALAAMTLSGCAGKIGNVVSASQFVTANPVSMGKLGPGDKVHFALYGDDAFTGDHIIGADGTISLPLIGAVAAQGLTSEELAALVQAKLGNGYYSNPKISVQVLEVLPVYVLGEVNKPGSYPYVADLTLSKAAALAGGYTYRARTSVVAVLKRGAKGEVFVEGDPALPLAPGDTLRVLERSF